MKGQHFPKRPGAVSSVSPRLSRSVAGRPFGGYARVARTRPQAG